MTAFLASGTGASAPISRPHRQPLGRLPTKQNASRLPACDCYPSLMPSQRSTWRSLLVASAMAAAGVLVVSHPAHACSGPPLTFDAAVSGSELIVEGTVEEVMLDGLAFRLAVKEVFKGSAGGADVRIGPTDPEGRGCEVGLQIGQHVVLGVVDVQAQLNSLATAVWFVAADGSLSSSGSLWEVATDVEDLRAKLRQAVPDTALTSKPLDAQTGIFLMALGLASLVLASAVVRRGRH